MMLEDIDALVGELNNEIVELPYDDTKIKKDIENLQEQINNIKVPTKLSELENDSKYITGFKEEDPVFSSSPVSSVTEEDIANWNNKSEFSGNYEDLEGVPESPRIPTKLSELTNDEGYLKKIPEGYATEEFVQEEFGKINIPTKVSELENDENFLKAVPNGYATEEFVQNKIDEIEIPVDYISSEQLNETIGNINSLLATLTTPNESEES